MAFRRRFGRVRRVIGRVRRRSRRSRFMHRFIGRRF